MKETQYYTATVRDLVIVSVEPFMTSTRVVREGVPYYKARFGRLVRVENDEPTTTLEEAEWWLQEQAHKMGNEAIGLPARFLDERTIKKSDMTASEAKQLRLAYQKQRKQ